MNAKIHEDINPQIHEDINPDEYSNDIPITNTSAFTYEEEKDAYGNVTREKVVWCGEGNYRSITPEYPTTVQNCTPALSLNIDEQGAQATVSKCGPYGMTWSLPTTPFEGNHGINYRVCNGQLYISHAQWNDPSIITELQQRGCTTQPMGTYIKQFPTYEPYQCEVACYKELITCPSPNLLRLIAADMNSRTIQMEGMDTNLLDIVKNKRPVEHKLLLSDVMCGMRHMHTRKLFHRDIKLENIFVDSFGTFKLADFGLSDVGGTDLRLKGSLNYMLSPRTPLKCQYGCACDRYAAGITFAAALLGFFPFQVSLENINEYKGPWTSFLFSMISGKITNIHESVVTKFFTQPYTADALRIRAYFRDEFWEVCMNGLPNVLII